MATRWKHRQVRKKAERDAGAKAQNDIETLAINEKNVLEQEEAEGFAKLQKDMSEDKQTLIQKEWDSLLEERLVLLDECLKDAQQVTENNKKDLVTIFNLIEDYVDELCATFHEKYEKHLGKEYYDSLRESLHDAYILSFESMVDARALLSKEAAGRKHLIDSDGSFAGSKESISSASSEALDQSKSSLINEQTCTHLIEAMKRAIDSESKLRSGKKGKQDKLRQHLATFESAEGPQKLEALKQFIFVASEPRKTMFFQANFAETASAEAFYRALIDDGARKLVSETLGYKMILPKPTPNDKNMADFVAAVTRASKGERGSNTPQIRK